MSGSVVPSVTNSFPGPSFPPVTILSPLCGMVHGDLESLLSVDGDLIATFGCHCPHCGDRETCSVALPGHLEPELKTFMGKRIGIMRRDEKYVVRRIA
jgi:hypothetical protein